MFNRFRGRLCAALGLVGALAAFVPETVLAVPSFGRQMGMQCSGCHTVFPELNGFGRIFKARGYTMGNALDDKKFPLNLPVSAGVLPSVSSISERTNVEPDMIPRNGRLSLQEAGVYYAGRIAGDFGAMAQINFDGLEHKWGFEMVDVRYANSVTLPGSGGELIWGATLNNNPSLADLYNSTPMWGFPHMMSDAVVMPAATVLLDNKLFGQVGGVGGYGYWNNMVYGEVALYGTTNSGFWRPFGWGFEKENIVRNAAPYWRVAVEQSWGPHMVEVGTLGLVANVYPDPEDLGTPTNRFTSYGFDAQYHYDADPHLVTAHGLWIREKQSWNASYAMGATSNSSDKLTTAKADVHYYYQRQYGVAVQRFATWGSEDQLIYNTGEPVTGSASGSPSTRGWVFEVDYLPVNWMKIGLSYTAYDQFNGAKSNYDGFGRNAKDNNVTYLYAWILL